MWISDKIYKLIAENRNEIVRLRAERDSFRDELTRSQILSDWLRLQVNTLQIERTALLEKAYGVKLPTPIIERAPSKVDDTMSKDFSFDDIGDELAKKLGLPTYDN